MASVRQNSRPSDIVWEGPKICYMHVNKVASNSLNHAMSHVLGANDKKRMGRSLDRDEWFIFAFVREPWDRLISAYTHNIKQGKITGPQKARGFVKGMTLADYIDAIVNTPDTECDKHYVPQSFRLSDDAGNVAPNWIGHIESMRDDWVSLCDALSDRTGQDCHWPLRWMKKRRHYRERIDAAEIESEHLKSLVKERYKRDYELWYPCAE